MPGHYPGMGCFYFNPRPPCGGRPPDGPASERRLKVFQSTSSVWRTTCSQGKDQAEKHYFNPRPPCGGRPLIARTPFRSCVISIHVLRVEDDRCIHQGIHGFPISIHVLRVEDDPNWLFIHGATCLISIHVLRVEDDLMLSPPSAGGADFNPRPPCGGRHAGAVNSAQKKKFQSTSSVWRTTVNRLTCTKFSAFQSTSSVWRTTPPYKRGRPPRRISIHVLRVEDDSQESAPLRNHDRFQSTSSVWRTTTREGERRPNSRISIHVLRVEDDRPMRCQTRSPTYFNPRPPCGGRRLRRGGRLHRTHFNPRPPCGGRRVAVSPLAGDVVISIHVLRVEDD